MEKGIVVLSLFDGCSGGRQALERANIKVDKYFASEIDKHAIKVTMANYPDTIQLGSVVDVKGEDLPKIDLLIGGSPCQSFSFAGKRKGMATKDNIEILTLEHYLELKSKGFEFEGQSYLFWEYMRILHEVKPKYFLLENVMMGEKWEKILSKAIGVNPVCINSALVSAQNRQRLYWCNFGVESVDLFGNVSYHIPQPKDKGILLKDILETEVDEKYYLSEKMVNGMIKSNPDKSFCIDASYHKGTDVNQYLEKHRRQLIVHNTMPKSSKTGKGGTGHLSRNDRKTYCLDTGQTNAVEIYNNKRLNQNIEKHKDELEDGILLDSYNQAICKDKSITISTRVNASACTHVYKNSRIRRLTPKECMRLQTVSDDYKMPVSDSQRYKMLGNGWTIDVIAHIFQYLKNK